MNIRDIIDEILSEESEAAKQAHKMGLVSLGWGKWGPRKGQPATHITQNGKLIPIEQSTSPRRHGKFGGGGWKYNRDRTRGGTTTRKSYPPGHVPDWKKKYQNNPDQSSQSSHHDRPFSPSPVPTKMDDGLDNNFYNWLPPNLSKLFAKVIDKKAIKKSSKFVKYILGIPDDRKFVVDGDYFKVSPHTIAYFHSMNKTLHIRPETVSTLNSISELSQSDLDRYAQAPGDNNIRNKLTALHVLIHEGLHARDKYLESPLNAFFADGTDTFVLEGMTEFKACQVSAALLFDENTVQKMNPNDFYRFFDTYYPVEMEAIQWLETTVPGTVSKLWAAENKAVRTKILADALRGHLETWVSQQDPNVVRTFLPHHEFGNLYDMAGKFLSTDNRLTNLFIMGAFSRFSLTGRGIRHALNTFEDILFTLKQKGIVI